MYADLPINLVQTSPSLLFRWAVVVDGQRVPQEGALPVGVDEAVRQLIKQHRQLMMENASLHGMLDAQTERVAERDVEIADMRKAAEPTAVVEATVTNAAAAVPKPAQSAKRGK